MWPPDADEFRSKECQLRLKKLKSLTTKAANLRDFRKDGKTLQLPILKSTIGRSGEGNPVNTSFDNSDCGHSYYLWRDRKGSQAYVPFIKGVKK